MMMPGVHKASGIDVLLAHLGLDRADAIAIGDSHNDLEMLAHAGVGIAMGNAPEVVRAVADEVTAAVDADGVRLAFLRHGLI
jgi:hydroxymethylpyrimidine pyrophosphatase-like HAD family hydrolase